MSCPSSLSSVTAPSLTKERFCALSTCEQTATHKCGHCKVTYYCSRTCQTTDYKSHKAFCRAQTLHVDQSIANRRNYTLETSVINFVATRPSVVASGRNCHWSPEREEKLNTYVSAGRMKKFLKTLWKSEPGVGLESAYSLYLSEKMLQGNVFAANEYLVRISEISLETTSDEEKNALHLKAQALVYVINCLQQMDMASISDPSVAGAFGNLYLYYSQSLQSIAPHFMNKVLQGDRSAGVSYFETHYRAALEEGIASSATPKWLKHEGMGAFVEAFNLGNSMRCLEGDALIEARREAFTRFLNRLQL